MPEPPEVDQLVPVDKMFAAVDMTNPEVMAAHVVRGLVTMVRRVEGQRQELVGRRRALNTLEGGLSEAEAENQALKHKLDQVLKLHQEGTTKDTIQYPSGPPLADGRCRHCRKRWPCKTVRLATWWPDDRR